jgi:PadR family transcriptional regulator PadR
MLAALHEASGGEAYGFQLGKATDLPSGSVYPILRRFEERGWVTSREEVIDPDARRPRHRVYYSLTAEGRRVARKAMQRHGVALRILSTGWQE